MNEQIFIDGNVAIALEASAPTKRPWALLLVAYGHSPRAWQEPQSQFGPRQREIYRLIEQLTRSITRQILKPLVD